MAWMHDQVAAIGEPSIEAWVRRDDQPVWIRDLLGRQPRCAAAEVTTIDPCASYIATSAFACPASATTNFALAREIMVASSSIVAARPRGAFDAANGQARRREVVHHHRACHQEHHQRSDDRQVELEMELAQLAVLLFREHVARAAQRENAARPLRIVFDGGAQARDVHVDRPIEVLEGLALGEIHQRLA